MNQQHPVDRRLTRAQRLTRTREFKQAYAQGRKFVGRTMVLWVRAEAGAALRLGVVASYKTGNAVARNRAKRRLREAFRLNRHKFAGEADIILIARRRILTAAWENIEQDLLALAQAAGIIARPTK